MADVGIRALEQNALALVAAAVAGERVVITDRGRPVAQLTALAASRVQRLIEGGQAGPPRRSLSDLPVPTPGPDLTAVLTEMRADERW